MVNTATDKGVSLSQDLYDLLKECFAEQVSYGDMVNQFDTSSIESINKVVSALTGGGYLSLDHAKAIMNGEALLNIVHDPSNGRYMAYAIKFKYGGIVDDYKINDPREDFLSLFVIDSTGKSKFYSVYGSVIRDSKTITDMSCYTAKPDMVWVVKNGAFMANDTIGAQVSAGACPQEVPDVSPWIKNPAIPDEWRIVQPGEKPDKDPDKDPDVLPSLFIRLRLTLTLIPSLIQNLEVRTIKKRTLKRILFHQYHIRTLTLILFRHRITRRIILRMMMTLTLIQFLPLLQSMEILRNCFHSVFRLIW